MPDYIVQEMVSCGLCGRLFVREATPGIDVDPATGAMRQRPKRSICGPCEHTPPIEEEVRVYRSYRLNGVKLRG